MAVYIITGKLGSGKTLSVVGRIRDALLNGKRVVTNLDIRPEKMLSPWHKSGELIRIPDKPVLADLEYIGLGSPDVNEDTFGLIVLDELGTWLNARTYQDPTRQPVIDWLLHSRKYGWDVYFIVQNLNMIDKQVREGLAEFVVTCRRTDRFKVPFFKHFGVRMPKFHIGFVRYGSERDSPVVERWIYKGKDLYDAYNTRQVFRPRDWPGGITAPVRVPLPGDTSGVERPRSFLRRLIGVPDPQRVVRPVSSPRPKLPLVEFLQTLPADIRLHEWRRFARLGWLEPSHASQFPQGNAVAS